MENKHVIVLLCQAKWTFLWVFLEESNFWSIISRREMVQNRLLFHTTTNAYLSKLLNYWCDHTVLILNFFLKKKRKEKKKWCTCLINFVLDNGILFLFNLWTNKYKWNLNPFESVRSYLWSQLKTAHYKSRNKLIIYPKKRSNKLIQGVKFFCLHNLFWHKR